jgi:hypothetical protein
MKILLLSFEKLENLADRMFWYWLSVDGRDSGIGGISSMIS